MSFEEWTEVFEKWLTLTGIDVSPTIVIADLRADGQGRGMLAVADIAQDAELFLIPRAKLLHLENSSLYTKSDTKTRANLQELGSWESLILALAWEWKVCGARSAWASYINVLPLNDSTYEYNQLMYWSDAQVAALRPSLVTQRIGKTEAEDMYHRLFDEVIVELGLTELQSVTMDDYLAVATVILSYSFDVKLDPADNEDDGEEEADLVKCMVPLADTLNANTHLHNAHLTYTADNLVMVATKAIAKGQQVYNTYLDHPNAELLRRYGYVEAGGTINEFGEVTLDNIKTSLRALYDDAESLIELVHELIDMTEYEDGVELITESYDCYKSGEVIPELIVLVQFLVMLVKVEIAEPFLANEDSNRTEHAGRIFKKCMQLIDSGRLTSGFIELYQDILNKRCNEYNVVDGPCDGKTRAGMARTVLHCELESLHNCLDTDKVFAQYKVIPDDKLLRNILKKRELEPKGESTKRKKSKK